MYGAVHTINNVFHSRMKYAFTPRITSASVKAAHSIIPHSGRYRSPTNSDAITNIRTPVPGVKKPTMILVVRNSQKFGEKTLTKPIIMTMARDGKSTFKRPNLERKNENELHETKLYKNLCMMQT